MTPMRLRCFRSISTSVLPLCCLVQLAASSGAASAQAARSRIDACALVTKAEVEAAVGRPVPEPKKQQVGNMASCSYMDPQTQRVIAVLEVFAGDDIAQARDVFKQRSRSAAPVQSVSGLGDDARWNAVSMLLNVLKGQYVVSVAIPRGLDAAKKLAASALQRLP